MTDFANALLLAANYLLVPAITYGCQLALGALGVTLVFQVLRFSNFAHGEYMSAGTAITILLVSLVQSYGIGFGSLPTAIVVLPLSCMIMIAVVLAIDRFTFRYYRCKRSEPIVNVIISVGVMFVMAGFVRFIVGTDDRSFNDGARFILKASETKAALGLDEGVTIQTTQVITILVTIAATVSLFLFLYRSKGGRMMRAYASNENLALLCGIDPDRIVRTTWIIAAILATLAGTLYGLDKSYKPFVYQQLLLPIFAAAILGGFGNPAGAVLGGFAIAFSEVFLTYAYIGLARYILPERILGDGLLQILPTEYKFAISFVILVVILIYRPLGIIRSQT